MFLPVREPGQPLWETVRKAVEKRRKREEVEKALREPSLAELEREKLRKQLEELSQAERVVEYPKKVEDDKLHHIVIFGVEGCGKSELARILAKEQKRCVVRFSEVVDWVRENCADSAVGKRVADTLKALDDERNKIVDEREKLKKKAGKKAPELETKWGPVNDAQFQYLPEDLIEECIKARL